VSLDVQATGQVGVKEAAGALPAAKGASSAVAKPLVLAPPDASVTTVLACAAATEKTCGAKASAAGEISALAAKQGAAGGFLAPPGCALPFGMQIGAALASKGKYLRLAEAFDSAATKGQEADVLAAEIRSFISTEWKVPASAVAAVQKAFKAGARIMVRSSANCEDLQAISGAGLYDSIANVKSDDADAVSQAINRVWQSLWTKRAALSRRAAGMKHTEAAMGVLVQEMVAGDLSFIAFSSNPVNRDANQVLCEGIHMTLGRCPLSIFCSRGTPPMSLSRP